MADLARLNYDPLTLQPTPADFDAYRAAREIPGYDGFDEQKAAPIKRRLFGRRAEADIWDRRYRLSAFAEANGMSYVFAADPTHWPGKLRGYNWLYNMVQTTTAAGQRVMTCRETAMTLGPARSDRGNPANARRLHFYQVVAVELSALIAVPPVFLRHRRRPRNDAGDQLRANYRVDDLLPLTPTAIDASYDAARRFLAPHLVQTILDNAPGYDLQLDLGWIYLMKASLSPEKKDADPGLLRERFTIAARVGAAAAAQPPGS